MQRGVTVEQVRRATQLLQKHGIKVGNVPHVGFTKARKSKTSRHGGARQADQPRYLLTDRLVSDQGHGVLRRRQSKSGPADRLGEASDRDYIINGRRSRDYYRLADQWLRNEVEAIATSRPAHSKLRAYISLRTLPANSLSYECARRRKRIA